MSFARFIDVFGSGTYSTIGMIIAWCAYLSRCLYLRVVINANTTPDAHNLGSETKRATGIPMFMGEKVLHCHMT